MTAVQSSLPSERSLVLRPALHETARARCLIQELAPGLGFSRERIFDICVAVSEAVANAIEHTEGEGEVRVQAHVHPDRLEIEIRGPGEFRLPTQAGGREHRGLGLPLMATLSDHLALYSVPDGGTLVGLTFYRPQAERSKSPSPLPPSQLELLRESRLVDTMLRAAPVAFHILDPDLKYKYVSPRYTALLDEQHQAEDIVGRPFADVRSHLPIPGKERLLARVSYAGEPAEFHQVAYRPGEREPRYFNWQAVPLGAGPPFDVLTIITEVTEQVVARQKVAAANRELRSQTEVLKRNQEELRRSREELEVAVAGSGGAEWEISVDPEDPYRLPERMTGSPRLKGLLGFADHEFPDSVSAWFERIHPHDLPRVQASARAHMEGRKAAHEVEYRVRHRDGSWRWLASSGRLFRDDGGRPTRWAGLEWDITERKAAERAAGIREQALIKAQSVSQTGSWRLDLAKGELLWSDEVYRMFGIPAGTPLDYERFLECVHPEDRAFVDQSWRAALAGASYDIEHRIVVGDEVRWVRERAELEFDAQGTLVTGFGTVQDMTERKKSDEERESLLARQEELTSQLAAANEGLQQRNRELARLYQEQRAIAGYLQEALLNVPAEHPDIRYGHVYHSATQMAIVGGDFYDIFAASGGRIGILMGDVSGHGVEAARIATMVKDSVHAFAHHFRTPRHVLRETNRLLLEREVPGFVTAFLAFLEPATGLLTYASAGHPNPVVSSRSSEAVLLLETTCAPLGVFSDATYRDHRFRIQDSQLLVLYTDGITEARAGRDLFGELGLVRALERLAHVPVEELPSLLLDEVLAFSGGVLRDDAALLALRLNA